MSRSRIAPGDGDPRHGTYNGYHNLGCRCEACRAANTAYYQEGPGRARQESYWRRQGHVPMAEYLAAIEPEHGTEGRYVHWGCRCHRCREAAAQARRLRRREVTAGLRPAPAVHGTRASYANGCRCAACRQANTDYHRAARARGKETAA